MDERLSIRFVVTLSRLTALGFPESAPASFRQRTRGVAGFTMRSGEHRGAGAGKSPRPSRSSNATVLWVTVGRLLVCAASSFAVAGAGLVLSAAAPAGSVQDVLDA
ncbi:hypothetical protein ACFRCI_19915 [Streptomyces sp. NPDC056638]|uniref:hypothetical protein n=1 Tax=Streptomyces sp. NPDC056638 TaxID=3345887 RepID=UPI0036C1D0C8